MPFNKYFQDELAYLREMGREFSAAYPALAPMLAERGGDPDVERLLEGFAFLTGRIREKLDDELPELMLTVAQLLFPQLVRPLPATSILEFTPLPSALREARTIPAGVEVQSVPVDGTRCRFRTSGDCIVAPWILSKVLLQDVAGGAQELHLELTLQQTGELARILPEILSLHFAGEPREALSLYAHVLQHTHEVILYDAARGMTGPTRSLPAAEVVRAQGFDEERALLPQVESAFPGFRLLQEYYIQPAKFSFVDVGGIRRAAELGAVTKLGVALRLSHRLRDVRRVSAENIRLHCVPVVNVFETTSEPIRVNQRRERFLVRPAGLGVGHGAVYSIEGVTTVLRGGHRVDVPSFLSFEHAAEMEDRSRVYYSEHLRSTVVGEGADTYLSLGTAADSGAIVDLDVLSVNLLATNGPLANALRSGEINEAAPSSPAFAKFKNIGPVSGFVPPPLGHDLKWRATAHAAMNLRALTEPAVLRTALGVYNLLALVDRQAARANELRIEAIRDVRVTPSEKLFRGACVRGVDIMVDLEESGFSGDGDMYLFGSLLERLFAEYVTINSFSRTGIRALGSNWEAKWPARNGNQTLL